MAKKFKYRITGLINNAQNVEEVDYSYTVNGKTIGDGSVNSDGSFTLKFKSKSKKLNGSFSFLGENGPSSANFSSGGIEYSIATPETTGFKAKAKKSPQTFSYAFALTNPIDDTPVDPGNNTITLSPFQDIYSDTRGGQVISGTFEDDGQRFTSGQNTVIALAGTLEQDDSLTDTSTGDNDLLRLTTTKTASLARAFNLVNSISGIETIEITGENDTSAVVNFNKVSGLEKLVIKGVFTARTTISNYLDTGAREFDFSERTGAGVLLGNNNNDFVSEPLTIKGSTSDDVLKASLGQATIEAGDGIDRITGSSQSACFYAGEGGLDTIILKAANAQDTVSLVGITTAANADTITGFVGAAALANGYDKLEIDQASFSNYTTGAAVTVINRTEALNRRGNANALLNTVFVVDNANELVALNLQSGAGTVGIIRDTNELIYSSNGDFTNNRYQAIATVNNSADLTGLNFQIS
jgi:hypothetical protein